MNVHEVPPCFLFSTWGTVRAYAVRPSFPSPQSDFAQRKFIKGQVRGQGGARARRMCPQGSLCTELPRVLPCAKARST